MKQRIRLSILMLWSFMHLLLFVFNGYRSEVISYFWPFLEDYNYVLTNNNANSYVSKIVWKIDILNIEYYDITELLVYGIIPIFFLCIYNYIKFNQFRLIIK